MADNSARTPGSGETIASDDVGGIKHQRVKVSVGTDGNANDARDGAVTASASVTSGTVAAGMFGWDDVAGSSKAARLGGRDGEAVASLLGVIPELYNGATADRRRNNEQGTLLASAARTATTTSAQQTNYNARGVILFLNATSAGTGTLTLSVEGLDPVSGNNFLLAAGTASAGTQRTLQIYPGALDVDIADDGRSSALPRVWQAKVTKSDASSWTFSLGYSMVV